MCNLHNQTLIYTATLNAAILKSNATPIRATTNANVETKKKMRKNHHNSVSFKIDFQFPLKPTFSFFRFFKCFYSPFFAKKSIPDRFFCYVWHAINVEIWPLVTQDLRNSPNNIKRQHPSTTQKHKKLPSTNPNLKPVPDLIRRTSHLYIFNNSKVCS